MSNATPIPDLSDSWPERLARVHSVPPAEGLVRPPRDAAKHALLEEMGQTGPYLPEAIIEEPDLDQPKAPVAPAEGETRTG